MKTALPILTAIFVLVAGASPMAAQTNDPGNPPQIATFPQCQGAPSMAPGQAPQMGSPYRLAYAQSWLRRRRDEGADVAVPNLGTPGERQRRVREVMDDYVHIHLGELNGREEHFCVPYAAIKSLEAVERGPDRPTAYRIVLFDEWLRR